MEEARLRVQLDCARAAVKYPKDLLARYSIDLQTPAAWLSAHADADAHNSPEVRLKLRSMASIRALQWAAEEQLSEAERAHETALERWIAYYMSVGLHHAVVEVMIRDSVRRVFIKGSREDVVAHCTPLLEAGKADVFLKSLEAELAARGCLLYYEVEDVDEIDDKRLGVGTGWLSQEHVNQILSNIEKVVESWPAV